MEIQNHFENDWAITLISNILFHYLNGISPWFSKYVDV